MRTHWGQRTEAVVVAAVLVVAVLMAPLPVLAQEYRYEGVIGRDDSYVLVAGGEGINNSSQVVGHYIWATKFSQGQRGFLWERGDVRRHIDYRGSWTKVYAINDNGLMIGCCPSFQYDGTTFTEIPIPASFEARGINNRGQLVGSGTHSGRVRAFLLDGDVLSVFDYPGASYTRASGVNDRGQIVGEFGYGDGVSHGFLKDGEIFRQIDVPDADGSGTVAYGINNRGKLAGTYWSGGRPYGFVTDGTMFTQINVPRSHMTDVKGINDLDQVVGSVRAIVGEPGEERIWEGAYIATPRTVD